MPDSNIFNLNSSIDNSNNIKSFIGEKEKLNISLDNNLLINEHSNSFRGKDNKVRKAEN